MVDKLTSIKGALTAKNRGTEEGSNPQKRTGMETSNKRLWIKIQGPRNDRVVIKPFHFGVHYFDTYSDAFKP